MLFSTTSGASFSSVIWPKFCTTGLSNIANVRISVTCCTTALSTFQVCHIAIEECHSYKIIDVHTIASLNMVALYNTSMEEEHVNAEQAIRSIHDTDSLRSGMCAICAERGSVIEKSVGRGLETKFVCQNCGSEEGVY